MTVIVSRSDLQADVSAAVRSTHSGPVIITENGASAYVLLSIASYRDLVGTTDVVLPADTARSLYDALLSAEGDVSDPEFEFPELKGDWGLNVQHF